MWDLLFTSPVSEVPSIREKKKSTKMEEAEDDDMTCGDLGNGLGRRPGGVYEGGNLQNTYSFRSRKGSGKVCSSLLSAKRVEEGDAAALPGSKRNSLNNGSSKKPVASSARQYSCGKSNL